MVSLEHNSFELAKNGRARLIPMISSVPRNCLRIDPERVIHDVLASAGVINKSAMKNSANIDVNINNLNDILIELTLSVILSIVFRIFLYLAFNLNRSCI